MEAIRKVCALSPGVRIWSNQALLKDVGLLPYMFRKEYGYEVTLLGYDHGEYPYLEYLPGVKMEFLPKYENHHQLAADQCSYIDEHYQDMDILVYIGAYLINDVTLRHYRKLRPDGKVVVNLDANSGWMDNIVWEDPRFVMFLDQCDVIATSNRATQRMLNHKWPFWSVEFLPCGFFNATNRPLPESPESKEKIILTVGRIGSDAKANELLLNAFALMQYDLPGWKVHLVGGVEPGFQGYIDEYYERFPQLKERVIFKGAIESKEELAREYERASVFAITSVVEGGPNVAAEALAHGCYMVTSEIDAWREITGNGSCGRAFPHGDWEGLADVLKEVCNQPAILKKAFPKAQRIARFHYNWQLNIRRIHHLLFDVQREER